MRATFSKLLAAAFVLRAGCLWALPTLQLDVVNGTYDPFTQTTVATSPNFTLRALLQGQNLLSGTYFVSAAIEPTLGELPQVPDFGTVKVDGVSYSSSANAASWFWGSPPLDVDDENAGNIAPHNVFPTYYLEFEFQFSALNTVAAYNTQDDAAAPGVLYYHDFDVSVLGLLPNYALHFDLYDLKLKRGDLVLGKFAPFSHDAESGPTGPDIEVPDGGATLLLLGCGLLGAALWHRLSRR